MAQGPGLQQVQRLSLQQILAPQLQQSLHLLQVSSLELSQLVHEELQQLEAAGLSRMDVLRAATGSAARALGMADSLGAIQPGRMADLVVLNRDPLQDLSALRDISCVFKGGAITEP